MKETVQSYLETGSLSSNIAGHKLHSLLNDWLIQHKLDVIMFTYIVAKQLTTVDDWVFELQKSFMYDTDAAYPISVTGDYDIVSNENKVTTYVVTPKSQVNEKSTKLTRLGKLKNYLTIEN